MIGFLSIIIGFGLVYAHFYALEMDSQGIPSVFFMGWFFAAAGAAVLTKKLIDKRQPSDHASVEPTNSPVPDSAGPARLVSCPDCDRQVSPKAPHCPQCGGPIAAPLQAIGSSEAQGQGRQATFSPNVWIYILLSFLAISWLTNPDSSDLRKHIADRKAEQAGRMFGSGLSEVARAGGLFRKQADAMTITRKNYWFYSVFIVKRENRQDAVVFGTWAGFYPI